jgi:hypothetical protein
MRFRASLTVLGTLRDDPSPDRYSKRIVANFKVAWLQRSAKWVNQAPPDASIIPQTAAKTDLAHCPPRVINSPSQRHPIEAEFSGIRRPPLARESRSVRGPSRSSSLPARATRHPSRRRSVALRRERLARRSRLRGHPPNRRWQAPYRRRHSEVTFRRARL